MPNNQWISTTSAVHPGFILGIGTNIDPEHNAARMLDRLSAQFGRILISRCYYTDPVGIATSHPFVNCCVYIQSDLSWSECKAACVGIEIALGRDRSDPCCKTRDRPADIDIVAQIAEGRSDADLSIEVDSYLAQPLAEIVSVINPGIATPEPRGLVCSLLLAGTTLGQSPATIDRDDSACLVWVRQDGRNGEHNRFGATFLA
jgi:2-amino-4-hydroxy-6-hydroxymethyldihydropteridine diphosphokinase